MKEIPLYLHGQIVANAIVDDEDYTWLSFRRWSVTKLGGYAHTRYAINQGRGMHRVIYRHARGDIPRGYMVDHINTDGLDNRRENLRLASSVENQRNRRSAQTNSKSGVLGVFWDKHHVKWTAQLYANGKLIHLGRYLDMNDAIAARLKGEAEHFGVYAPLAARAGSPGSSLAAG